MSQHAELCAKCGRKITTKLIDGQVCGPYRFTRYGKPEVYCSRVCRDGINGPVARAITEKQRRNPKFSEADKKTQIRLNKNARQRRWRGHVDGQSGFLGGYGLEPFRPSTST